VIQLYPCAHNSSTQKETSPACFTGLADRV
jgi:hypothetical protein